MAAEEASTALAPLAPLVGGEWEIISNSGTVMHEGWRWGPDRLSLRAVTVGHGADGQPWRAVEVLYWHPGRRQILSLIANAYEGSVAEGVVRLGDGSREAFMEMHQTRGRRDLKSRWEFRGPDDLHHALSERDGAGEYSLLAAWDWRRVALTGAERSVAVQGAEEPRGPLGALAPLIHEGWVAVAAGVELGGVGVRSSVAWIPLANVLHIRTVSGAGSGPSDHLLDAYVYRHTGSGTLRCLALFQGGGVCEGEVRVGEGGGLLVQLQGAKLDGPVRFEAAVEFEAEGRVRTRVWSLTGSERSLAVEARHARGGKEQDEP